MLLMGSLAQPKVFLEILQRFVETRFVASENIEVLKLLKLLKLLEL